jgi:pseudomonalisin
MKKGVRSRVFGALASAVGLTLGLANLSWAALPETQRNVPHWASQANHVASAAETDRVTIVAYLSLRNQSALKDLIAAQATPTSPSYGKYLTPEQFHAQFSPNAANVQRVQRSLEKLGFRIDHVPASGLFVRASGSVAQVKATFGVSQELYSYKGKILRANAETPRIPATISDVVTYVAGLDQTAQLRQPSHIRLNETERSASQVAARAATSDHAAPNAPPPVAANLPSIVCSNYWGEQNATQSARTDRASALESSTCMPRRPSRTMSTAIRRITGCRA